MLLETTYIKPHIQYLNLHICSFRNYIFELHLQHICSFSVYICSLYMQFLTTYTSFIIQYMQIHICYKIKFSCSFHITHICSVSNIYVINGLQLCSFIYVITYAAHVLCSLTYMLYMEHICSFKYVVNSMHICCICRIYVI